MRANPAVFKTIRALFLRASQMFRERIVAVVTWHDSAGNGRRRKANGSSCSSGREGDQFFFAFRLEERFDVGKGEKYDRFKKQ